MVKRKPKKLHDGRNMTIYMEKTQLNHVRHMAIKMSHQEGRDISVSEAIRMAIDTCYPMAQQMDMFGKAQVKRKLRRTNVEQYAFF